MCKPTATMAHRTERAPPKPRAPAAFTLALGVALSWTIASSGCAGEECKADTTAMRAFILDEANQVCTSDQDCAAAHVGCAEIDLAFCGQVGMSRAAAESAAWRTLVEESSCEESCAQCAASLIPTCTNGFCFRPQPGRAEHVYGQMAAAGLRRVARVGRL